MPDNTGDAVHREGSGHGDDEFAAVVLDEAFVRGAVVHEPSADERIAAAVEARMRERPPGGRLLGAPGFAPPPELPGVLGADDIHRAGARTAARSHRMVAWVLAVMMGLGVLAMAVSAVYRSASGPVIRPVDSVPSDMDSSTSAPHATRAPHAPQSAPAP